MEDGIGMISDKAARTSLKELRTTTPMPTAPKSSKTTPSKLIFKVPALGGAKMNSFDTKI